MLQPLDPLMRGRHLAAAHQAAGRRLEQRLDHQCGLAAAGDTGDAGEGAERDFPRHILQVVAARADDLDAALRVEGAAQLRHRDAARARQILTGDGGGVRLDLRRRALGDDAPAALAGGGADIDQVVRAADRILVMLHDQHRIAQVAQAPQRHQQAFIVALVQPDRGLVQHIQHAREPAADLRRQPDALGFAAREGRG